MVSYACFFDQADISATQFTTIRFEFYVECNGPINFHDISKHISNLHMIHLVKSIRWLAFMICGVVIVLSI